jgi:hypothetical protein
MRILLACCAATSLAHGADDVYRATDPEPTPAETQILEFINRFRADPAAEAARIAPENGPAAAGIFGNVDLKMFRDEMRALKPAPPLVFNLQLIDAARKHSHYIILNSMTHDETPGKPGFTGASPGDRLKAAGYPGGGFGENIFRDAGNPWTSHVGFTVDGGAGPGGMQPGRGHRANMISPGFREIGVGALPHDGRLAVTHDFSNRSAARLVGGVVYVDLDGNGSYDPGEGKGGVVIVAGDGSRCTTWASGAFTLELKSAGATVIGAEYNGQRQSRPLPAGSENVQFDWAIPQQAEFAAADKLLAAVEKETDPASPARFKAAVALAMGARGLLLDAARAEKVAAATGEVATALDAAQRTVRDALASDPAGVRKLVAEPLKTYRGTAAAEWFKEAELAATAAQSVNGFIQQAGAAKPAPSAARDLIRQLEGARDGMRSEFRGRLDGLIARVRSYAPTT